MKRLLALILCVLMLAALFPISALANEDEGDPCAEGHTYTSTTTATCTAAGSTTYTCSVCGYSYSVDAAALGHNYNAVVTEPTCTAAGSTTYTCSVCGYSYSVDAAALGHNYNAVVTEPTCTAAGFTTYTCSRCGDSYQDNETPALGHSYGQGLVTLPNCTTEGYTAYTCSRCGDVKKENVTDPRGHSYGQGTVVNPNCTTEGYTAYTCADCGDVKKENVTDALGHDYECVVTKEPTDEEPGVKTYTCTRCKDTYTESFTNQPAVRLATALKSNRGDPKSIGDCAITAIPAQGYTGSAVTPIPEIKDGDYTLVEDTDFTITGYENNIEISTDTATVTVMGIGAYTGEVSVTFDIKPALTVRVKDQTYDFTNSQQGENNATYSTSTAINDKVVITGTLIEGDSVTSITLNGLETNIGEYTNRIDMTNIVIDDNDSNNGTSNDKYVINKVKGKLTINATVTVTADPSAGGTPTATPAKGLAPTGSTQGTEITLDPKPASGYVFDRWVVDKGGVTIGSNNKFRIVSDTQNVEITAKYLEEVTVTFNANGHGTAPAVQKIGKGKTATYPGNLSASGWIFDGWFTTSSGTTPFDFSSGINANTTVYAKWTPEVSYTVTKGEYTRWWKGGIEGVTITVKRSPDDSTCFDHFSKVAIDDTILAKSAYTAKKGSTVIYLKPETLQKLHRGYHDVTILFDDGEAYATLRIYSGAPKTGDSNDNIGNWLALLLLSGFGFGSVIAVNMKKKARRSGRR